MTKLRHKISINAPVDRVWKVLNSLDEVGNYNPMVVNAKYISENKTGVGAARECEFKPKGHGKERVIDVKEGTSISMEMFESDWPLKFMRWTNNLSSENGTTIIRTDTEYQMKFGFFGVLLDSIVMKRKFTKILDELFVSLKNYVELKK